MVIEVEVLTELILRLSMTLVGCHRFADGQRTSYEMSDVIDDNSNR